MLHLATQQGNLEIVKFIIDNILEKAASANANLGVAQLISDNKIDINPRGINGFTPLHIAVQQGRLEIFKTLAEVTFNKNVRCKQNFTPLHEAAVRDHLAICKLIVPQVKERNPRDNLGRTPLHYAAKGGNFGIINYISVFAKDVHPLDDDGKTPQNYMEQNYENLRGKINYFVSQNDSENSTGPKAKSKSFKWKYYAKNGKVRKRTFVSRKRTLDFSDRNKKMKLLP